MRELRVHYDIRVSDTKQMLSPRVGFISSNLTTNKLLPINPRAIPGPPKMSLLLKVESSPALVVKPRFILIAHTDDLGRYITSNQQGQVLIQNLNRIVSRPNVTPRQILQSTPTVFQLTWCFKKTFLLTHKFGTA